MANASIQCKPVSTFAKQQRGGERKTEPPPSGSHFANAVNMAMGLGTSLEHAVCGRRFSGRSWRPERSELLAVVVSRSRSRPSPWPESSITPSLVRRLPLLSPSPPLGLAPVQYFCRSPGAGFVLAGDLVVVRQRCRRSVRPVGWEARGYRRIGAVRLRLDGAYRFASGYLERSIQIGRSGGVI